jgi:hypothetical protein
VCLTPSLNSSLLRLYFFTITRVFKSSRFLPFESNVQYSPNRYRSLVSLLPECSDNSFSLCSSHLYTDYGPFSLLPIKDVKISSNEVLSFERFYSPSSAALPLWLELASRLSFTLMPYRSCLVSLMLPVTS